MVMVRDEYQERRPVEGRLGASKPWNFFASRFRWVGAASWSECAGNQKVMPTRLSFSLLQGIQSNG